MQVEELVLAASWVVNVIFQLDYGLSLEHVVGLSGQVYIFGEDLFFLHVLDLSPELDLHLLGWYKLVFSLGVFDGSQADFRWHFPNGNFLLQNRMALTFIFLLLPQHTQFLYIRFFITSDVDEEMMIFVDNNKKLDEKDIKPIVDCAVFSRK